MPFASILGRLHAGLERGHQVDHLRCLGSDRRHLELFTGSLALDEVEHALAVLVAILRWVEIGRQRFHQCLGHLHFLGADVDVVQHVELVDAANVDHLVGEHHGAHQQLAILGADGRHVLLVAHDESPDAHLAGLFHRLCQQHVRLGGLVGSDDVRRVEVNRVDVHQIDELLEVDALGGRRDERFEFVGIDDHVPTLRHLEAFDDVLVGHIIAGLGRDLLQLDAAHRAIVQLVERDALLADAVEELDGDRDKTERDGSAPHRPRHVAQFARSHRKETAL